MGGVVPTIFQIREVCCGGRLMSYNPIGVGLDHHTGVSLAGNSTPPPPNPGGAVVATVGLYNIRDSAQAAGIVAPATIAATMIILRMSCLVDLAPDILLARLGYSNVSPLTLPHPICSKRTTAEPAPLCNVASGVPRPPGVTAGAIPFVADNGRLSRPLLHVGDFNGPQLEYASS
jgi:hypothetical protein